MVVVCRNWTRLPITDNVIKSVQPSGADMPPQPVFTDRRGNLIGDGPSYYNENPQDAADDNELPGLLLPELADEIPGVDVNEEFVEITGVDMHRKSLLLELKLALVLMILPVLLSRSFQ